MNWDYKCPTCGAQNGESHLDYCTHGMKEPNKYVEPETDCHCADVSSDGKFPAAGNIAIPLEFQLWLYEQMAEKALDDLVDILMRPDSRAEIIEMGKNRMAAGFPVYGCTMYTWDARTRRRNLFEELADASVYDTGGPLE